MTAQDQVRAWVEAHDGEFTASDVKIPFVIKPHISRTLSHLAQIGMIVAVGQKRLRRTPGRLGGRPEKVWRKV